MNEAAGTGVIAHVRDLTKRSGSSFYYSFLVLPREKREAIYAVYALSREIDDAVDEAASAGEGRARLSLWEEEVRLIASGEPTHPVARAVAKARERFSIPVAAMEALLEGARMDLERKRYSTFDELRLYCERVASAVGRMCIEIFGYRSPRTRDYAKDLGIALQLTNILRDLGADAGRGRLYLPLEDLDRFGVRERDILEGRRTGEVLSLLRFEAGRTKQYYVSAEGALERCDRRSLVAAEVMRGIYRSLLAAIESSRFDVFGRRIALARGRRAALALGVYLRTKLSPF